MKKRIQEIFDESVKVKTAACQDNLDAMIDSVEIITDSFRNQGKLFIFGNGGSAADSQHIAAEFVGRFQKERRSLPAIALTTDTSALTALGNDYGFEQIFARQLAGLGQAGDVALGISTSGNSMNILTAFAVAKESGIKTIALTGNGGGKLKAAADVNIIVPSKNTARIQESHICIAHCLCELIEEKLTEN